MAGDWIKWSKGLHKKREVRSIAARMSIHPIHSAGLCMVLWEWLDENVSVGDVDEDGNAHVTLGALQPEFLDDIVGANGFAAALSAEKWLNIRSGSLVVPNYIRHNGQTAKDRALTAERVARSRHGARSKCNAPTVTDVTLPPLPEKRREDVLKRERSARAEFPWEADVIAYGKTLVPPADEAFCRAWWNEMEGAGWYDRQKRPVHPTGWKHSFAGSHNGNIHYGKEMAARGSRYPNQPKHPGKPAEGAPW